MELTTLLTAIAAFLTSVITMLTVSEMKKQRVVAHLPIIKILGNHVEVKIDKSQNWLWEKEKLSINNFGKGVALDVEVKWEVKINEIIQLLKKYDPHNVKGFSLKNNFLKLDNSYHAIKIQSERSIPAISENTNTPNEIAIPTYLTAAFGTYINESVLNRPKESKSKSFETDDFPDTYLKVKYLDINNNLHERNFSLKISLSFVTEGSDSNYGNASISFETKDMSA